jgi:hypothetical protein
MNKIIIVLIIISIFLAILGIFVGMKDYMISNIIKEKEFLVSQKTHLEKIESDEKSEKLHNTNNMINEFEHQLKFWNAIP